MTKGSWGNPAEIEHSTALTLEPDLGNASGGNIREDLHDASCCRRRQQLFSCRLLFC